jgi:hypothetical protein
MKASAVLLLFCTLSCSAAGPTENAPDVTSKVFEQDLDGGKVHLRTEEFFRGKKRVLIISQRTEANLTKTARNYEVGDIELIESDENGDGAFETLIVYNMKTKEIEAFLRKTDGSVIPMDANTLAATKDQFDVMAGFWDQTLGKGVSPDVFLESAKALKKKLNELRN